MAATSPSLVPASPWVGPCDLKGKISPYPPLGVVAVGSGVSSSSPWKIRFPKTQEAVQGPHTHDSDPHAGWMEAPECVGSRQLWSISWLVQQQQPPGVWPGVGPWQPRTCWRAKGAGDRRATLALGPRASPLGTGLDVPITAAPCGTRKLSGTGPRADGSPVHFLCTWTLAYSEKDGSGLGVGCLGARLRCTMSRSA